MRNITLALAAVAAVALATPASARTGITTGTMNGVTGTGITAGTKDASGHRSGISIEVGRAYARDVA